MLFDFYLIYQIGLSFLSYANNNFIHIWDLMFFEKSTLENFPFSDQIILIKRTANNYHRIIIKNWLMAANKALLLW